MYKDFTLLVDGKNAFPSILDSINNAKKSLHINMFIWRDDNIGNQMASAVLSCANRGVKVYISVDRYGLVLEKCEECKRSFFHKQSTFVENLKIKALELTYPMANTPRKSKEEYSLLYKSIISHPNITVSKDIFKADHSKFYIIDNEILFVGGINIEDKENGQDMQGRVYQDYMVKICGKQYVQAFLDKLENGKHSLADYSFYLNRKKPYLFEMEEHYLSIINSAKETLYITMAYFSPLPKFTDAILSAYNRGVKVVILVPKHANFQSDSNLKTVCTLLKQTNNGITVYLSPKMVHTKLVMNESVISFGSTNITKKAFNQLNEINLCVKNTPCDFVNSLTNSIYENHALSKKVTYKDIKYNKLTAFIEGFLV